MSAVVVDASALAEYLLRTSRAPSVEAVVRDPDSYLFVPALCDVEISSVLRRALLDGRLSEERAAEAVADYRDLPLTRHGHQLLMDRILALRNSVTAYDATCVALAERLDARLLTGDRALARAVEGLVGVTVVTV